MLLNVMKDRTNALARGDFSAASFLSIQISHIAARSDSLEIYNNFDDLNFINQAFQKYAEYKLNIPAKELAFSGQHYEVVFDAIIPNSWNLDADLIIIDSALCDERKFENFLHDIGQKSYIFFRSDNSTKSHIPGCNLDPKLVLDRIGMVLPKRVAFFLDKKDENAVSFEREVRENLRRLSLERNTIRNFEDVWLENIVNAIPFYRNAYCASELEKAFSGRQVLIISPGPSLLKCADALAKQRSKYVVLAVAQAIPTLVKLKITPDFVMVVDPKDYSMVLSGLDFQAVKGLIAFEAIHKNFFSAGFRDVFLVSPPSSPIENYKWLNGKPIQLAGGSVSVQACALAIKMGASLVGLVGQDLCLPGGVQYAHVNSDEIGMVSGKITRNELGELFFAYANGSCRPIYSVKGRLGEELLTPEDYFMYLAQLKEIALECQTNSNVKLFNFSEGGAQIDGFHNESLESFESSFGPLCEFFPQRSSDYIQKLMNFVASCIDANESFSQYEKIIKLDDKNVIEKFLSIPSIRFFGQKDLVEFFSCFDNSMTVDGVERNQFSLESIMNDSLSAHISFFRKLKSAISSF